MKQKIQIVANYNKVRNVIQYELFLLYYPQQLTISATMLGDRI